MSDLDDKVDFRTLVAHFRKRTDVQNIDLMNMAGFCRNCMAKWYAAAATEQGLTHWQHGCSAERLAKWFWWVSRFSV